MKLCVLNLRGLGAGHVGPYGNRWVATPALNALASQASLFDRHLSAHPDAAGLVWRTGRPPHVGPAPRERLVAGPASPRRWHRRGGASRR